MADDAAQLLDPGQLGDAQAAVPVPTAEQQAPVVGHHQHPGADVQPGGEGPAQEPLGPATDRKGQGEDTNKSRGSGR